MEVKNCVLKALTLSHAFNVVHGTTKALNF